MDLAYYRSRLEEAGVVFEPGLTAVEVACAERTYALRFPPDLRQFLMFALPVSPEWYNWRDPDSEVIRRRLAWPYEGICFDIEHNDFWLEAWGTRPASLEEAFIVAKRHVERAPKLIPIRGHRFIPEQPHEAGNPVLSVHQTDIIRYGASLGDYLAREFRYFFGGTAGRVGGPIRTIEFWSDLVE